MNNRNPLQRITADPTLPHQFHHVNGIMLAYMDSVFLPLDLVIVWCRLSSVAHQREELLPRGGESPSPSRTHQLISQVIKSAGFTPLAINQNGNK